MTLRSSALAARRDIRKSASHHRLNRSARNTLQLVEELESRILLSTNILTTPLRTGAINVTSSIAGLNSPNFILSNSVLSPAATSGPTGLSPAQMLTAYGLNNISFNGITGDGTGQTIAIIDAYDAPNIVNDLATFDRVYGLPTANLIKLNQTGGTTLPSADTANRGDSWAVETSLDVEWAHAIAPGATIVLIEANSAFDSDLMTAVNTARSYPGVSVVSMSYGGPESSFDLSDNSSFTTPSGHQGVTFVASSGDEGAYGALTASKIVEYPAASPNVLSVGGTSLYTSGTSGTYVTEAAWGNGTLSASQGGSGGGISKYETQPSYQSGVVTQSTTFRTVPDISMDANPDQGGVSFVDSWDFSASTPWSVVGGTSLAAPMWAGIVAIINQGRVSTGAGTYSGQEFAKAIYQAPSADFHDIISGNNGYAAGTGYDLTTGRGSPVGNILIPDLSGTVAVVQPGVPSIGSFTISPNAVQAGTSITLSASNVTEISGTISTVKFYRESNSTSGLQIGNDTLVGTATLVGTTWTFTASTTGFTSGNYTYYAVATDTQGVTTTSSAILTIVAPTIQTFTANPSTATVDSTITLTASGVTETNGTIGLVAFYRESNGSAGFQSTGDLLLGYGVRSGNSYTLTTSTNGLAAGVYKYYALAIDDVGVSGLVASVNVTLLPASTSGSSGPVNDYFAGATTIVGSSITITGTNVDATEETGEPEHANTPGNSSVWFAWTAPASGQVFINTHGSGFDTLLAVYTGDDVTRLSAIASNDNDVANNTSTSLVSFNAVAGTKYMIAIDGYLGATGTYTLNLSQVATTTNQPIPANDNFNNATVLTGNYFTWTGSNVGATRETGEPTLAGNTGGASVWLSWTPTLSGVYTLNTAGSMTEAGGQLDTLLGVFTGSSLDSLTRIATNDDDSIRQRLTSTVAFQATAGTTYYFVVDGYNGAAGNLVVTLS